MDWLRSTLEENGIKSIALMLRLRDFRPNVEIVSLKSRAIMDQSSGDNSGTYELFIVSS